MVIKINGLALSVGESEVLLPTRAASLLGVPNGAVTDVRIIRKSLDARRARPPRFIYLLTVRLPDGIPVSVDKTAAGVTVTEEIAIPEEGQAVSSGTAHQKVFGGMQRLDHLTVRFSAGGLQIVSVLQS